MCAHYQESINYFQISKIGINLLRQLASSQYIFCHVSPIKIRPSNCCTTNDHYSITTQYSKIEYIYILHTGRQYEAFVFKFIFITVKQCCRIAKEISVNVVVKFLCCTYLTYTQQCYQIYFTTYVIFRPIATARAFIRKFEQTHFWHYPLPLLGHNLPTSSSITVLLADKKMYIHCSYCNRKRKSYMCSMSAKANKFRLQYA